MLSSITSAASQLHGTITATTTALDAIGRTDLESAVAELERAADEAAARLDTAAVMVRRTLVNLQARMGGIAANLVSDVGTATMSASPATIAQEATAAVVEPKAVLTPDVAVSEPATVTVTATVEIAPEPAPTVDPEPVAVPAFDTTPPASTIAQPETADETVTIAALSPVDVPEISVQSKLDAALEELRRGAWRDNKEVARLVGCSVATVRTARKLLGDLGDEA